MNLIDRKVEWPRKIKACILHLTQAQNLCYSPAHFPCLGPGLGSRGVIRMRIQKS